MPNCENFRIFIRNDHSVEVRATKLEYIDGSRSKNENLFSLGSDTFDPGETKDYTRNLQGIGGERTRLTVTYQHRSGNNNWGTNRVETTPEFECGDGESRTVVLN